MLLICCFGGSLQRKGPEVFSLSLTNSGQSPSWDIQRNPKHPNLIIIPYIPGILCFLLCILVIIPCSETHRTFLFCTRTGEEKYPINTQTKHSPPFFTYSALCAGSRSHSAQQCFSLTPTGSHGASPGCCCPSQTLWTDRPVLHVPLLGNNTAILLAEDTGDIKNQ